MSQDAEGVRGILAATLTEHAFLYVGLLLVMTAGLYKVFFPNKGIKVTLNDV